MTCPATPPTLTAVDPMLRTPSAIHARRLLLLAGFVVLSVFLVLGGHEVVVMLERLATLQAAAAEVMLSHPAVVLLLVCYVLLLAIPFVPGAELGFFLLLLFGADIVPHVYFATIAGMMLSFSVGRLIPHYRVVAALSSLGLHRLAARLELANSNDLFTGSGWFGRMLKYRYPALGLVINTPGNTVLGGGGGLGLAAGASRLYSPLGYLVTVMIAVSPVPLGFLIIMP